MKIQTIPFHEISYQANQYEPSLKASLFRMGQGFPIKVKRRDDQTLQCVDGNKRMSALFDILKEDPTSALANVKVLIVNEARTSSGTSMNHH